MEKAAKIDPDRSLEFLGELGLQGWELTNSLKGYVKAKGENGKWREAIGDIEFFENHRGKDGEPRAFSPGTENMIAGQWMREDFDEGIHWFTKEIPRDYSKVDDVKNVASVLASVLEEERFQVVDWIEDQRGQAGWNDQLVLKLGKSWARAEVNTNTERLVSLMGAEEDRFQFASIFIGRSEPFPKFKLRHSPDSLNRLVEAANLSEANSAKLKEVIAAAQWTGS